MSQTVSVDVVGRTYWAYLASIMAEGLTKLSAEPAATNVIPKAVYSDAVEFLRLALEGATDAVPRNPSASIANYLIAAGAVHASTPTVDNRAHVRATLEEYARLVNQLASDQPLATTDRDIAARLQVFFQEIQQEAEAEAYDKIVEFDSPHVSLRVR